MHRVAIVAFDGVVPFDLATPCEVFGRTKLRDGVPAYSVRVCGVSHDVSAGAFTIRTHHGLRGLIGAETVIVPGISDITTPIPRELSSALVRAASRGARIASICSGAFVLAAAGLLDGRRATTHWLATSELARRYPSIQVDPDVLFVDGGHILTSAGAAAGLDLCLHMVRRDYGAAVAADAARASVMPLERDGGQAQFIVHPPASSDVSLRPLLDWIDRNVESPLTLDAMARRAAVSVRTLSRRFREQVGTTPLQWLLRARVRRAQLLLETTAHPLELVATKSGFGSTTTLREQFRKLVGTNPRGYRRAFSGRIVESPTLR